MSEQELAVIKERAEKATSGPWEVDGWVGSITNEGGSVDVISSIDGQLYVYTEDANFIAHAREDVPKLVAEVERLRNAEIALRFIKAVCLAAKANYIEESDIDEILALIEEAQE